MLETSFRPSALMARRDHVLCLDKDDCVEHLARNGVDGVDGVTS